MSSHNLPKRHRALVLTTTDQPPEVKVIPTPQPSVGSAVVRMQVVSILSYAREVYDGTRKYALPTPLVIEAAALVV